jgi:hypothetical protein
LPDCVGYAAPVNCIVPLPPQPALSIVGEG